MTNLSSRSKHVLNDMIKPIDPMAIEQIPDCIVMSVRDFFDLKGESLPEELRKPGLLVWANLQDMTYEIAKCDD